ncbi:MAG: hypothetical protein O7J95_16300 [Planctomycetota bacterium]|nr:hypothetical protein [Planctomycetota bacterium]
MSTRRLVVISLLSIICVGCLYTIVETMIEAMRSSEPRRLVGPQTIFPQNSEDPEAPPPLVEDLPPASEPRELAIRGWVYSGALEPLGGGRFHLGEESVAVSRDGRFEFPPARRGRTATLVYADATTRLEFPGTLTGDRTAGLGGGDSDATEPGLTLPARPARLAWTLILPPAPSIPARRPSLVSREVLVEEWGRGGRIRVSGRSDLPDGSLINGHARFDDFRVGGAREAKLADGDWRSTIVLSDLVRLYAGRYELVFDFSEVLQPAAVIALFSDAELAAIRAQGTEIVERRPIFVGDLESARREDLKEQRYYQRVLVESRQLYDGLMGRVRDTVRIGKGWDPALLSVHRRLHDDWFQEHFVSEQGDFEEARWREFLDERFRPRVEQLIEEQASRSSRKYQEAENRMGGILDSLLRLSRLYSTLHVYATFNLPSHPKDYYADERGQGDIAILESRLHENFQEIRRFLELVPDATREEESEEEPENTGENTGEKTPGPSK